MMAKLIGSILRTCLAVILIVSLLTQLEASPLLVPIASFPAPPGAKPIGKLLYDGSSYLWGTTTVGGLYSSGTVFKVDKNTGAMTTVIHFANTTSGDNRGGSPSWGLMDDGAGAFWGTTSHGGVNNGGTVFKIDPVAGTITTVADLVGGPASALVKDNLGYIWGTTTSGGAANAGTLFKLDPSNNTVTIKADFTHSATGNSRGGGPQFELVKDSSGKIWGETTGGGAGSYGTLFKVDPGAGTISTVVDFTNTTTGSARGGIPAGGLAEDGAGNIWGVTTLGGTNGFGTIFKVNLSSGVITTVLDLASSLSSPSWPQGGLFNDGAGFLWGTSTRGGASNIGTVFNINVSTGVLTTKANFSAITGSSPLGALVSDGAGNLWGTVGSTSGTTTNGGVFKFNKTTSALTGYANYSTTGAVPCAGLLLDSSGNLWGTTSIGGANSVGTVFKVVPAIGAITTAVSFVGNAGNFVDGNPTGTLMSDGSFFWGTTWGGGSADRGTVFKINPSTSAFSSVAQFSAATGASPSGLVKDSGGVFWGTTHSGGTANAGTVFELSGTTISTRLSFSQTTSGTDRGGSPYAALVSDGVGSFWGTASAGGANGQGTIFKVNSSTSSTMVDFANTTSGLYRGGKPQGALVKDALGNLWGTTVTGGAGGKGTVFKYSISTTAFTTVVDFVGGMVGDSRGSSPVAGLVIDGAGNLWGTTTQDGAYGGGTVFKIDANTNSIATVFDLPSGTSPLGALLATPSGLFGAGSRGGINGAGNIFFIDLGPQFAPPSAGSITSSGATISGSANPEGLAASVSVEYGLDTGYGATTSSTSLGSGTSSVPFSIGLSSLSPGTTYHYRLAFVTAYGTFYSADQTFATSLSVGRPTYTQVFNFQLSGGSPFRGALVSDGLGNFWGTTQGGGGTGNGTVFKVNAATGEITTVVNFGSDANSEGLSPQSALVSDGAGCLWGTTSSGGPAGYGTIFKVNVSTGEIQTMSEFDYFTTGAGPNELVSDGAGYFWGTTGGGGAHYSGTVFKVDSTGVISKKGDFDYATTGSGANGLVSDGMGNFWGTTANGGSHSYGTVFMVDGSGTITNEGNFSNDTALTTSDRGRNPVGTLVSDGSGYLWGVTQNGGTGSSGTVFKVDPSAAGGAGVIATEVDFVYTSNSLNAARGAYPLGGLVSDGLGYLWGTTSDSGMHSAGTVFKVEAVTGNIYNEGDFERTRTGLGRGAAPGNALVKDGAGNLWGMTNVGGSAGLGTIYTVSIASGGITTVADMGTNPNYPYCGMTSDSAGDLWGTTSRGGAYNFGTVFKLDTAAGTVSTKVDFTFTGGADSRGALPVSGLTSDGADHLWGTTAEGGANGGGTIFELDVSTETIATRFDFANNMTGDTPVGALVSDMAGIGGSAVNLWGTTFDGAGSVFLVNTSTGIASTQAVFANTNDLMVDNRGSAPRAGLVSDGSGYYWGTTSSGGAYWSGTVFKIKASDGTVSTLVDFADTDDLMNECRGGQPQAALVRDGTGNFWGTTYEGGTRGVGTLFKVDSSGHIRTIVDFKNFDPTEDRGAYPQATLVSDGAGNLWGTTTAGGTIGYGTVFKINTNSEEITTLIDFTGSSGSAPGAIPNGESSFGPLTMTSSGAYGTVTGGGAGGGGVIFFINLGPQFGVSVGSITNSGATVSGGANPLGMATDVLIQYGTTTSYGSTTGSTSLGSGTSSVSFSQALSGLSPGTAYHYRLEFDTGFGKFYSADQVFTTAY